MKNSLHKSCSMSTKPCTKKGKKREKKMKLAPISHVVDLFNVSIVRAINQPYHKSPRTLAWVVNR